jgi:hypothetical protein
MLFGITQVASASHYSGCVIGGSNQWNDGQWGNGSYGRDDVCEHGECEIFSVPNCGLNCTAEVCFAAEDTTCSVPYLTPATGPAVVVGCGQQITVNVVCKSNNSNAAAYVCHVYQCGSCEAAEVENDHLDNIIADWVGSQWVTMYQVQLTCNCNH